MVRSEQKAQDDKPRRFCRSCPHALAILRAQWSRPSLQARQVRSAPCQSIATFGAAVAPLAGLRSFGLPLAYGEAPQ